MKMEFQIQMEILEIFYFSGILFLEQQKSPENTQKNLGLGIKSKKLGIFNYYSQLLDRKILRVSCIQSSQKMITTLQL